VLGVPISYKTSADCSGPELITHSVTVIRREDIERSFHSFDNDPKIIIDSNQLDDLHSQP
jgi:hypothetical protein